MANIRSAYAEAVADALSTNTKNSTAITKTVTLKQQQDDWQTTPDFTGELKKAIDDGGTAPKKDGTCTITYTPSTQDWSVIFS